MGIIAHPGTEGPKSAVEPSRPSSHTSVTKQGFLGHVANPINQSQRVQALRATAGMINQPPQGRFEESSAPAQLEEGPALAPDLSEPSDGVDPAVSTPRVPEFASRPGYLAQLADSINSGPRMQALRATAQMIAQHLPMAQTRQSEDDREGPAQRKPLVTVKQSGSHEGVVQARSMVRYGAPQNFSYHNPPAAGAALNANTQVATRMDAELDLNDPIKGSGVGAGIAANAMTDLGLNFPAHAWVQGHLLNSNLGGLGINSNLFPITNTANSQHTWAVEYNVKELLYGQPGGGNFALGNNGYLEYQVIVNPAAAPPTSQAPNATYACSYRTQQDQGAGPPAAAPAWNPWQQVTVQSQTALPAAVPAAWTPFGAGIGVPIGGGGAVNVAAYPVVILANPLNPYHAAMLAALGLGAPPPIPGGAQFFLAQQAPAGPALKIIGWQF